VIVDQDVHLLGAQVRIIDVVDELLVRLMGDAPEDEAPKCPFLSRYKEDGVAEVDNFDRAAVFQAPAAASFRRKAQLPSRGHLEGTHDARLSLVVIL
jgi:hypothetical protein